MKNNKSIIKKPFRLLRSATSATKRTLEPVRRPPDEMLGELFQAVQLSRIHPDGKTFVDQVPNRQMREIVKLYKLQSAEDGFNLAAFIDENFQAFSAATTHTPGDAAHDPEAHIQSLWDALIREAPASTGSLLVLPKPYIVPGGRFSEQYYWDSYFTMLGLEASGRSDITDGMIHNMQHFFAKFGFIPTANRTYYLSRSQPPFFLHMVRLVGRRKGRNRTLLPRLHYLVMEYTYWTKNTPTFLKMGKTHYRRLVRMPNNQALSRYYDGKSSARPESFREDVETAEHSPEPAATYRHLRAGAESGWDFSSRWLADPNRLESIRTTDIVPIDLNCLLYELELSLSEAYKKILQLPLAAYYARRAKRRRATINQYMWDESRGYYFDWYSPSGSHTDVWSLAGVFPLYCGVATHAQAARVAVAIEEKFLKPGGVVTSLHETGQQWDAPNGWAPLQWVTIVGLRRYGYNKLADTIRDRWLATNTAVFANQGKFLEKYNVVDPTARGGGGGEYTLQDGFGWTNGVFMALRRSLDHALTENVPEDH